MITVLLLLICILSSGFTGNLYKTLSNESRSVLHSAAFPCGWYLLLGIFFSAVTFAEKSSFANTLIPVAAVAGVCIFAAASILIESMKVAPLSISLIIINLNFIIPVLLSALFLQEKAGVVQLGGMILSIGMIIFINRAPKNGSGKKYAAILLPLIASVANGLVNFCIKINEKENGDAMPFFAVMYLCAALCSLLAAAFLARKKNNRLPLSKKAVKPISVAVLLMALCNGLCFYMTDLLASRMNAAAQFTTVTCMSILLSLGVGFLFQGDKLTRKSLLSILCCIIAILCQAGAIL